jgi:YHYH protein
MSHKRIFAILLLLIATTTTIIGYAYAGQTLTNLVHHVQDFKTEFEIKQTTGDKKGPLIARNVGTSVDIGDGKFSTQPTKGYILACNTNIPPMAQVAQVDGPWIKSDGTYNPDEKIHVQGDVSWPNHSLNISLSGGNRTITTNDLPNHNTGIFPVSPSDPVYNLDRNPNTISSKNINWSLPSNPAFASSSSCLSRGIIGVINSGAVLFNGLDVMNRDAVAHEIQDKCNGHPGFDGEYHYHGGSNCYDESVKTKQSTLAGYAKDGFGIYGNYENGKEITNEDLDECHGHVGTVLWNGSNQSIFHYHLTKEYPYSLGCYRGNPIP